MIDWCLCDVNYKALLKQGDNVFGSLSPSICVSVCRFGQTLMFEPFKS